MPSTIVEQGYIEASGDATDDILRDQSLPVGERFERAREGILDEITRLSADIATLGEEAALSQVERLEELTARLSEFETKGHQPIEILDACLNFLHPSDPDTRREALGILRGNTHPEVTEALLKGITNPSNRRFCVEQLAAHHTVEAAEALLEYGIPDADKKIRWAAQAALSKQPAEILAELADHPQMNRLRLQVKIFDGMLTLEEEAKQRNEERLARFPDFVVSAMKKLGFGYPERKPVNASDLERFVDPSEVPHLEHELRFMNTEHVLIECIGSVSAKNGPGKATGYQIDELQPLIKRIAIPD